MVDGHCSWKLSVRRIQCWQEKHVHSEFNGDTPTCCLNTVNHSEKKNEPAITFAAKETSILSNQSDLFLPGFFGRWSGSFGL
jgi:hypothetical protein